MAPASDAPIPVAITVTAKNQLAVASKLYVDEVLIGQVERGSTATLSLLSSAKTLRWDPVREYIDRGQLVSHDFATISVPLPGISTSATLTNVSNGLTYIFPRFRNTSGSQATICIASSPTAVPRRVADAGVAAPGSPYVGFAYLLFGSSTELRVYPNSPSSCTGHFLYWSNDVLSTFAIGSGIIDLDIPTAP